MSTRLHLLASGAIALLSSYLHTTTAANLDEWRGRTIYQLLTDRFARPDGSTTADCNVVDGLYCGGSWSGIVDKLDYVQGMGFDAIWISPVVKQLPQTTGYGQAYTGYWTQDLYNLNSHFGTGDDLKELVNAVHDRGMYLMLDIVVNHMGYAGAAKNVDYSAFVPFDDKKYFHNYCPIDGDTNQTQVEMCWLGDNTVALADLRTEDQGVQDILGEWISSLVGNYSIDGLRIDTAVNVDPEFFADFVDAAGVFATGETMDGDNTYVCRWAETIGSILNYPIYYPLTRAFADSKGSINDLVATIYTMQENCADPTAFGLFSENHDVPRFAESSNDTALAKNILTFTIMGDGIPIIYQGQEQHMAGGTNPYTNRAALWTTGYNTKSELYQHITTLIQARQHILRTSDEYAALATEVIYQDYHSFAMRKGNDGQQVITVLNNNGEDTDDFKLYVKGHGLPSGTKVTEILTCKEIMVDKAGQLVVPMGAGLPKIMYPSKLLKDSGLCGNAQPTPVTTVIETTYPTTIGGHSTLVSTSITTTALPSHTRLALGSAHRDRIDALTPIVIALLSMMLAASSGACLIFW